MASTYIDLTSSPETSPKPNYPRHTITNSSSGAFLSQKPSGHKDEDASSTHAARAALQHFLPRKQKEYIPLSVPGYTCFVKTRPDNADNVQGPRESISRPTSRQTHSKEVGAGSLAALLRDEQLTPLSLTRNRSPQSASSVQQSHIRPTAREDLRRRFTLAAAGSQPKYEHSTGESKSSPFQHVHELDEEQLRAVKRRRLDAEDGKATRLLDNGRSVGQNPEARPSSDRPKVPGQASTHGPSRSTSIVESPHTSIRSAYHARPVEVQTSRPADSAWKDEKKHELLNGILHDSPSGTDGHANETVERYQSARPAISSQLDRSSLSSAASRTISGPSSQLETSGSDTDSSPLLDAEDSAESETSTEFAVPEVSLRQTPQKVPENVVTSTKPGAPVTGQSTSLQTSHGEPYSAADDELLIRLKEVDKLSWNEICTYFPRRTSGSIQVRYSGIRKKREAQASSAKYATAKRSATQTLHGSIKADAPSGIPVRVQRIKRNVEESVVNGFISWKELKNRSRQDHDSRQESPAIKAIDSAQFEGERLQRRSLNRILRQREIGAGPSSNLRASEELKEHVFNDLGPLKYFKGTSGDVMSLAWSSNGDHFAAGSIAISDERSMQYNRPYNLLLGERRRSTLRELPEHHIPRPKIRALDNVNALQSMEATQEPRLFMTVAHVQFSADGSKLYTAGTDRQARAYSTSNASCLYELDHPAPLDLLSAHGHDNDVLATACHQSADGSVGVYCGRERLLSLSPSRIDQRTDRPIFPSALRWGAAARHAVYLLAGFSIASNDAERDIAGEACLWDVAAEKRIHVSGVTGSVFDVAWNPLPSLRSSIFAVASARGTVNGSRGKRTVVQCFSPGQNETVTRAIEYDCPAFDINDIVYCPHDDNLIAAGATDGKVYLWDQRYAKRNQAPLHVLEHGDTLNVLDHDREREIADTGVRFLSWGATSSRLYSGSSDGVVKVWNPYRSTENAHVSDIGTFESAVMSGAFSPDYRDLLIGEDQGRINLLSVGHGHRAVRSMQRFELLRAPLPEVSHDPTLLAKELVDANEILITPMGDLPKFQAVQGPNYQGPFFGPSQEEVNEAEMQVSVTRRDRLRIVASLQLGAIHNFNDPEQALRQAQQKEQEARATLQDLQSKVNEYRGMEAYASATQSAFRARIKQRLPCEDEPCKLDCNYLPADVDNDGAVLDSRRSESRIPNALFRSGPLIDTALMTPEDAIEAGLKAKCTSCLAPAPRAAKGRLPLCDRCAYTRLGLTATCEKCSTPIRPPSDASESKLCEKCHFGCFRCGKRAVVWHDARISCRDCGLVWKAGVLGYDLVSPSNSKRQVLGYSPLKAKLNVRRDGEERGESSRDELDPDDLEFERLGLEEIEHYASLWQ